MRHWKHALALAVVASALVALGAGALPAAGEEGSEPLT
jgi:hypothetical protein